MSVDLRREGFFETGPLTGAEPAINMPKVTGGIQRAPVGSSHELTLHGRKIRLSTRDVGAHPKASAQVICLGVWQSVHGLPLRRECSCKPLDVPAGELPLAERAEPVFAAMISAHGPTTELAKNHEQHVIALVSFDSLNPAKDDELQRDYQDRVDALKSCDAVTKDGKVVKPADYVTKSHLLREWGGHPRPPEREIVGLLSSAAWPSDV